MPRRGSPSELTERRPKQQSRQTASASLARGQEMAKRSGPGKPPSGDEPYEVGYKKPPEHTRFQPGTSGNPKGRQKGVNNLATDIKNALASKITVRSGGKGRVVSTQEAGIMILKEKA